MVSSSLALLYFLLSFHGGRQGSGPNRRQSPVEWGDFPFIRPSPLLAIQPGLRPSQRCLKPEAWLAGPEAWLAGPQAWLAGPQAWLAGPQAWLAGPQACLAGPEGGTDKQTDERTDK